jgi:hypothetical protein
MATQGDVTDTRRTTMLTPGPRCSAGLTGGPTCTSCGLPLTGPVALLLWQVDQRIAEVDHRIADLQKRAPAAVVGTRPDRRRAEPGRPRRPDRKQEWTPRRVQNLLLTLGALLPVIAGAIFTAVSWRHLGVAVRGAILLSLTGAAAAGCRTLARRGLTATAEAVSGVCLGLGVFYVYAFHALVLPRGLPLRLLGGGHCRARRRVVRPGPAHQGAGAVDRDRSTRPAANGHPCADSTQADRALLLSLDALLATSGLAALLRLGCTGQTVTDLRS